MLFSRRGRWVVLVVLVLAALTVAAHTAARSAADTVPEFARRGSDRGAAAEQADDQALDELRKGIHLITLSLTLADEKPVTVAVPTGAMATYRSYRYPGYVIGVIPRVVDVDGERVLVDLVEVAGGRESRRVVNLVETVDGKVGFEQVSAAHRALPLSVQVVAFELASQDVVSRCSAPSQVVGPDGGDSLMPVWYGSGCCVSCQYGETCGCLVFSSCGSCCGSCGGC